MTWGEYCAVNQSINLNSELSSNRIHTQNCTIRHNTQHKMPEYRQQDFDEKIEMVTNAYGSLPLSHTPMDEALRMKPTSDTILAMVIDALVKSRPISHQLAQFTVAGLIEDGYHNIDKLSGTSWEERTNLLSQVGYNRYREQCATNLGNLSDFVLARYGMKSSCYTVPSNLVRFKY
jgi:hypothetical protein